MACSWWWPACRRNASATACLDRARWRPAGGRWPTCTPSPNASIRTTSSPWKFGRAECPSPSSDACLRPRTPEEITSPTMICFSTLSRRTTATPNHFWAHLVPLTGICDLSDNTNCNNNNKGSTVSRRNTNLPATTNFNSQGQRSRSNGTTNHV